MNRTIRSLAAPSVLAVLGLLVPAVAGGADAPPLLEPGGRIELTLAGGAADATAELAEGELATFEVEEQPGEPLELIVTTPGGETSWRARSPLGGIGPVPIALVAPVSGMFRVAVRALEPSAAPTTISLSCELRSDDDAQRSRELAAAAADWATATALVDPASLRERLPDLETWRRAEALYRGALATWRTEGDERRIALGLDSVAYALWWEKRHEEAAALLEESQPIWERLGDRRARARGVALLAERESWRGRHAAAAEIERRVVALWEEIGDSGRLAGAWEDLGLELSAAGDPLAALDALERSRQLELAVGREVAAAWALNQAARIHASLGEYEEAFAKWSEALPMLARGGDPLGAGQVRVYRAAALRTLGDSEQALAELDLARRAIEPTHNRGWLGFADVGRCGALRDLGRYDEALVACAQAREDYASENIAWAIGMAESERGAVLDDAGRLAEAEETLSAALAIHRAQSDELRAALTLERLGRVRRQRGVAGATEILEEARARWARLARPQAEAETLVELARAERQAGATRAALEHAESALARFESARGHLPTSDLRVSFLAAVRDAYELALGLRLERAAAEPGSSDLEAAFALAERSRARLLLESLGDPLACPPELAARQRELRARVTGLQKRLLAGDAREGGAIESEVAQLDAEMADLERRLRGLRPFPDRLPEGGVAELQQALGADAAWLEYAELEDRYVLFVVTRDSFGVARLGARERIEASAARLRRELERPALRTGPLQLAARAAYDELLAPVGDLLRGRSHLIVSPDGALAALPFEVLVEPGGAPTHPAYLVRRFEIGYAPSVAVALALRDAAPSSPRGEKRPEVVVFADPRLASAAAGDGAPPLGPSLREFLLGGAGRLVPLPGAEREARRIVAGFPPGSTELFLGERATETAVETEPDVARAARLHFATHALVSDRFPRYSAVVLGASADSDGLLQAFEIAGLRLDADLVVLSACRTGLGRETRGEGLLGLTQSFLQAGARRLVVSLWPVEDAATSDLMASFYGGLARGLGAIEALRAAKLARLETAATAHPFYWAPFVTVGGLEAEHDAAARRR